MGAGLGVSIVIWLHIAAAAVAVGGVFFLRTVALPFAARLDEGGREAFQGQLRRRFFPLLWTSFAVLFLTGLHNLVRIWPAGGAGLRALVALKVILAFVVFGVGLGLTLPGFAGLKARRARWLAVNLIVAFVVIFLGTFISN